MINFQLEISYRQISFFLSNLQDPFNDWSDTHAQQGFSWRDQSVSFSTLIDSGTMEVEVETSAKLTISNDSVRAISVPFEIPAGIDVEIASITDSQILQFKPGKYQLVYQVGKMGEKDWCRFTLIKDGDMQPKILKQDDGLKPPIKLLMVAQPAT